MTGQKRHRTKKDIIGRENRYLLAASDWSIIFLYHTKGIFILTMQLPGLVRYGGTDGLGIVHPLDWGRSLCRAGMNVERKVK